MNASKYIEDRQAHRRKFSNLTGSHGKSEQRSTHAKSIDPTNSLDKVDIAQDAALTHQEEGEAQQTQQIKGTFWHSGNLWIVAEHLNTGNQRPDKWEQKGKRSAIGNVFFKSSRYRDAKKQFRSDPPLQSEGQ